MNVRIIITRVLILYSTIYIKNPSFFYKKYIKTKKPFSKCQRAGNGQAPPIGHVQNF
jgi:hypothetical protein